MRLTKSPSASDIHRSALHEWTRWQAITAAIFLFNGGVYSFKYSYETTRIIGDTRITPLFSPICIPGIVAIAASFLILLLENDVGVFSLLDNHATKMVLYLLVGVFSGLQLTLTQPAVFLIVITIELAVDAWRQHNHSDGTSSSSVLPK
eukprot:jgi/Hompol1/1770/HPOL_001938-RA